MQERPEHDPDPEPDEESGATGESSADTPPALPSDDDSPLGDTDEHSDA